MRLISPQIVAVLLMNLLANPLFGQLSPGPLSPQHADLSGITNCLQCHTWGSKDLTPKCLDCHTEIQTRIIKGSGYHGLMEDVLTQCTQCHSDHHDLEVPLIRWQPDRDTFDHEATGYLLEGKHGELSCDECHSTKHVLATDILERANALGRPQFLDDTHLGLGTACADCHEDVHQGEFEEQACQDCHTQDRWTDVHDRFDHASQTQYALEGAHAQVACEKCHTESWPASDGQVVHKFTGLKYDRCTRCHEDEHRGAFGQDCLECHTMKNFKTIKGAGFDHDGTRFALRGRHRVIECASCHTQDGQFKAFASFDECMDCHEDTHRGRFAEDNGRTQCETCHHEQRFFPSTYGIQKHQTTDFPLEGSHLAVPCFACHNRGDELIFDWQSLSCETCHTDPHGAQFALEKSPPLACERCHQSEAWSDLLFDHDETTFPLTGAHTEATCAQCHLQEAGVVQYVGTNPRCGACHTDAHAGQFEDQDCGTCHSSSTWAIADFDHETQTRFPLGSQHNTLDCGACHKFEPAIETVRFKPVFSRCQDCHSFGGTR